MVGFGPAEQAVLVPMTVRGGECAELVGLRAGIMIATKWFSSNSLLKRRIEKRTKTLCLLSR